MNLQSKTEEIIEMYVTQNLTTVEIANILGASSSGVGRLLNRNGIKLTHTPNELRASDAVRSEICARYQNGETTVELGDAFGLCDRTIAKIVREGGGKIRAGIRRSLVQNHDYFEVIDTPDKAYFLGWMISDGSVVESKTREGRSAVIAIDIHSKDRYILEEFAKCIGADKDIVRDFKKRCHSHIRFASQKMSDDLAQYGVVPGKTHLAYLPRVSADLMPHLIRGVFDGDGTVTKSQGSIRFAFYGTEQLCLGVRDYLHEKIGARIAPVSKSTCYHVWWGKKSTVTDFYNLIYENCGDLYLHRKKDKFETVA